jgi:Ca2+-binding RTX toxin-like protein
LRAATRWFRLTKASVSLGTRRIVLAVSTPALGMLALAAPASATTVTFNYTGAGQTWTVPAGVTQATFDLYGAQGGGGCCPATVFPPGLGGQAKATIAVTAGTSIQVNVGGAGSADSGPGFNGGGSAAPLTGTPGGGASDIRVGGTALTDRALVAGGGGGSGWFACDNGLSAGGHGGGLSGLPGTDTTCDTSVMGGGGTQTAGGNAGTGQAGQFGGGGNGRGGGGGGGWYGGGGGVEGGGGGGSGYGPTGTAFQTGVRSGNGLVTVTYTVAIDTLIQLVEALALPTALENQLLRKLNTAADNLDAGNATGACNQLAAFTSQVKRRSGNGIPTAGADDLIAAAGEVRGTLNCGAGLTCAGRAATIVGTGRDDKLRGTNGDDVIAAGGGDDRVVGLAGDDLICGSGGADEIRSGGGDDTLKGGRAKDDLRGGGGSNKCRGGDGSDSKHQC